MQNSSTFCPLPWNHVFISETGHFNICCSADRTNAKNSNGQDLHISNIEDFNEVRKSELFQKTRRNLSSNIKDAGCIACWKREYLGQKSLRYWMQKTFNHSEILLDASIEFLDIRIGNICNLACRMCTPISSTNLISDYEKLFDNSHNFRENYGDLNWVEKDKNWEKILNASVSLKKLSIGGGEPLIHKKTFWYLNELVKVGISREIELTFYTNLTILPDSIFELAKKFKVMNFAVSLDGLDNINEYIRYPSKFGNIDKNIRKILKYRNEIQSISLEFHTVVQVYNAFNIPELLSYMALTDFTDVHFTLSQVSGFECFSISNLPEPIKDTLKLKYMDFIQKIPTDTNQNNVHKIKQEVTALIETVNKECHPGSWAKFLEVTEYYDRTRNQKISDFVPELKVHI